MIEPVDDSEMVEVNRHVDALMEHFDTVQIFVTKHDGANDRTLRIAHGGGNWYARVGYLSAWLDRQRELELIEMRQEESEE